MMETHHGIRSRGSIRKSGPDSARQLRQNFGGVWFPATLLAGPRHSTQNRSSQPWTVGPNLPQWSAPTRVKRENRSRGVSCELEFVLHHRTHTAHLDASVSNEIV